MNPSPEILNELKGISPLLASLEKINVFRVPAGYFDELHQRIADYALLNNTSAVDNINKRSGQQVPPGYFDTLSDSILAKVRAAYPESAEEELHKLSPLLSSLKSNIFSVPDGYFESFAANTIEKLKVQHDDLQSAEEEIYLLSPLLSTLKTNVFSVPEGYFESFAANMADKLTLQTYKTEDAGEELNGLSPVLAPLKTNVFTVPAGYFESFAASVMQKLASESHANSETAEDELRAVAPALAALKENVFAVPDGYFESFAGEVMEKLKPQPARIIPMTKRSTWWKYAAAAVVTGAIAVSSLQIFNNYPGNSDGTSVVTESGLPADVKASFQYKTEADLNAGIAKLSDDDIIKYLEKSGNIMDNELLTNNTDVSEMPSQADYLTDENTLNSYLDKIDAETDKSKP